MKTYVAALNKIPGIGLKKLANTRENKIGPKVTLLDTCISKNTSLTNQSSAGTTGSIQIDLGGKL